MLGDEFSVVNLTELALVWVLKVGTKSLCLNVGVAFGVVEDSGGP